MTLPLSYSRPLGGIRQSAWDRTESNTLCAPISSTTPATSQWWREEDSNLRSSQGAADLQSAAINHSAISPIENQISSSFDVMAFWSWRRDLNPRPADYKSAALPTELRQPVGKTRNLAETFGIRNREFCLFDKIRAAGLHLSQQGRAHTFGAITGRNLPSNVNSTHPNLRPSIIIERTNRRRGCTKSALLQALSHHQTRFS